MSRENSSLPRQDNILNYINDLIEQGYREEDAERMANVMFSDDGWNEADDHVEDERYEYED